MKIEKKCMDFECVSLSISEERERVALFVQPIERKNCVLFLTAENFKTCATLTTTEFVCERVLFIFSYTYLNILLLL